MRDRILGALTATAGAAIAAVACAPSNSDGPAIPAGAYELEATMGEQAFPVRLELLGIEDRPWGRLTVVAGQERVVAVRGTDVGSGGAWQFAAGGPVHGLELRFADSDSVSGTLSLGGMPPVPLQGRRSGDLAAATAEELRSHHALEPIGLAARAGEAGASFPTGTPDGALIFSRHGPDLSRQTLMIAPSGPDGGWDTPVVMALSGDHSDRSPAVLPDGSGLVFASDRPAGPDDEFEGYRLWLAPRLDTGGWGDVAPVEFEGGWEHDARQPSITAEGTLYFSSAAPGGRGEGDIFVATPDPTAPARWAAPRNLGEPINGPGDEHGAFVSPDGSYMLLTSAGGRSDSGPGGDDLYVSRRTADGWSTPRPLGLPINTFANEYGASVSGEGLLYFTSDRYGYASIFRVEADAVGLLAAEPVSLEAG